MVKRWMLECAIQRTTTDDTGRNRARKTTRGIYNIAKVVEYNILVGGKQADPDVEQQHLCVTE